MAIWGTFFGEPGTFDHFPMPATSGFSASCAASEPIGIGGDSGVSRWIFGGYRGHASAVAEQLEDDRQGGR